MKARWNVQRINKLVCVSLVSSFVLACCGLLHVAVASRSPWQTAVYDKELEHSRIQSHLLPSVNGTSLVMLEAFSSSSIDLGVSIRFVLPPWLSFRKEDEATA